MCDGQNEHSVHSIEISFAQVLWFGCLRGCSVALQRDILGDFMLAWAQDMGGSKSE